MSSQEATEGEEKSELRERECPFGMARKRGSGRFDLLLEEGEYFRGLLGRAWRAAIPRVPPQPGALVNLRQVRQDKVCSLGLMFDPEDKSGQSQVTVQDQEGTCGGVFTEAGHVLL